MDIKDITITSFSTMPKFPNYSCNFLTYKGFNRPWRFSPVFDGSFFYSTKIRWEYIWTTPAFDLIAQFSRKYIFLEGMNLRKTLIPFFYLWVHFWIFHGQKCKNPAVQPRSFYAYTFGFISNTKGLWYKPLHRKLLPMMESLRINRSKTIFQYYAIQTLKTDKILK